MNLTFKGHRDTVISCLWSTGTQSAVYGPQGHSQLFYGPQGHSQLFVWSTGTAMSCSWSTGTQSAVLWSTGKQSGVYGSQGHNQLFLWSTGARQLFMVHRSTSTVYGPQGHSQLFYGPCERSIYEYTVILYFMVIFGLPPIFRERITCF